MPVHRGQNSGKEAVQISIEDYWLDFEQMQNLPERFRHWLEYDANDTYQVRSIFNYHVGHGRSFAEIERFMRDFSRKQYEEDYAWTGEKPPHRKGDNNEQLPKLRNAFDVDRQSGQLAVQMQRGSRPQSRRRRASLSRNAVENDDDYYQW